jgi:prepilin-type processing-associated H-X9-DG protein
MNFTAAGGPPVPKLIFAIDAGEQANALEKRVRALMQQADQRPLTMFLGNKNGIVRFAMGYDLDELDRLAAGEGANSLAASESFARTMGGLTGSPTSAFYMDFPRLIAMGEEAAAAFAPPEDQAKVKQMIDALGIRGLGQLGATSGFSGKMYETRAFLGVTGRDGFMQLMPEGPLDPQTLSAIPAGSTMVVANQFDLAALLDVMRQIVVEIEPQAEAEIDRFIAQVNDAAGVDVQADVLNQLGKTWAYYTTPQIGNGVFSAVSVNRPQDAAKMDQALTSTSRNLLALANEHIKPETEGNIALPGRSLEVDGQTLHILNIPVIAPTWSVDQEAGLLRLAMYPQSILSARAIDAEPFTDSQAWRSMSEQLGAEGEVTSLSYVDLRSFAPTSYPLILMFTQTGFGAADLFSEKLGTQPPVVILPPLATMLQHIEPSGSVSWMADGGVHFRSLEPFPGSNVLAMDVQTMALQMGLSAASAAMPAAAQAREAATRVQGAANLRQIGVGAMTYAHEHEGKLPSSLRELYLAGYGLPMHAFISPRMGTELPEMMAQSMEAQADWVEAHSDFVWNGRGRKLDELQPQTAIAWEKTGRVSDGLNILFADGHVEFVPFPRAATLIEEAFNAGVAAN